MLLFLTKYYCFLFFLKYIFSHILHLQIKYHNNILFLPLSFPLKNTVYTTSLSLVYLFLQFTLIILLPPLLPLNPSFISFSQNSSNTVISTTKTTILLLVLHQKINQLQQLSLSFSL